MRLLGDALASQEEKFSSSFNSIVKQNFIVEEPFRDRADVGQIPLTVSRPLFIFKALKDYALQLQ